MCSLKAMKFVRGRFERSQRVFRATAARVPDLTHARRGGESASEVEIILRKFGGTAARTEREAQPPVGYTDPQDTQPTRKR